MEYFLSLPHPYLFPHGSDGIWDVGPSGRKEYLMKVDTRDVRVHNDELENECSVSKYCKRCVIQRDERARKNRMIPCLLLSAKHDTNHGE